MVSLAIAPASAAAPSTMLRPPPGWKSSYAAAFLAASAAVAIGASSFVSAPPEPLPSVGVSGAPDDAEFARRFLLDVVLDGDGGGGGNGFGDSGDNGNDDDRDESCKKYLESFLKASTDASDECEGMLNAYEGAGCAEEEDADGNRGKPDFDKWRRWWWHRVFGDDDDSVPDDGGNSTDDDLTQIDDFIVHFRCCDAIHSYYLLHCHEPQISSGTVLSVIVVLVICGLVKALLRMFSVGWLPEAGGCILVGSAFGAFLKATHPEMNIDHLSFDEDLFLCVLLPPIIFQAALSIDKAAFRRYLLPIGAFAVFGTAISAALTGLIVFGMTKIFTFLPQLPFLDSLVFGSLISSVDPVATLSILSSVGVTETDKLYILVFGEALLNDGVAVVLFRTLIAHLERNAVMDESIFWESVHKFFWVSAGSVVIGLACSAMCLIYFWLLRRRHEPVLEVALFFCFALIPYYVADSVGASGIIAVMTAGFFLDAFVIGNGSAAMMTEEDASQDSIPYEGLPPTNGGVPACSFPNRQEIVGVFSGDGYLSVKATRHIDFVAEVISTVMETAIFAYLGLFLFVDKRLRNVPLNLTAILACMISRTVAIYALSWIVNCIQACWGICRQRPLAPGREVPEAVDRKTQLVLLLSGMRGAVSLALAESVPLHNAVTGRGSKFKPELKAMASSSVIFTVFNLGALTYYLVEQRGGLSEETPSGDERGVVAYGGENPLQEPLMELADEQAPTPTDAETRT